MIPLKDAIETLIQELAKDKREGSYYYSWQANIAMAFKDTYKQRFPTHADHTNAMANINEVANNAAKNFLDLLIMDVNKNK